MINCSLFSVTTDGKITEVVVHGIQKRYDPEKHYVFILKLTRQGIKDPVYVFRTYKQVKCDPLMFPGQAGQRIMKNI